LGKQPADSRFGQSKRLLNARDYSRVFDKPDARASHQHLLLLGRFNGLDHHRLGLVIAKKHVRLAVQRNRIKRLAREFFRLLPETGAYMDVVFLARRDIDKLENAELSSILQHQWQRLDRVSALTPTHTRQDS
jgi:ribonuclease P protein component